MPRFELPRKKDKSFERRLRKRRCPGCGKVFRTTPGYLNHIGAALTSAELNIPLEEAAVLWAKFGPSLITRDDEGNRIIQVPDEAGEESSHAEKM